MARTTLNIDDPVLEEVKRMGRRESKSLGRMVSELLSDALGRRGTEVAQPPSFDWTSKAMAARVDLEDKEAVYRLLDRES